MLQNSQGGLKLALFDKLSAIGEAVRDKTGKTEKLTLAQMPTEIESIQTGGSGTTGTYKEVRILFDSASGIDVSKYVSNVKQIVFIGTVVNMKEYQGGLLTPEYHGAYYCANSGAMGKNGELKLRHTSAQDFKNLQWIRNKTYFGKYVLELTNGGILRPYIVDQTTGNMNYSTIYAFLDLGYMEG